MKRSNYLSAIAAFNFARTLLRTLLCALSPLIIVAAAPISLTRHSHAGANLQETSPNTNQPIQLRQGEPLTRSIAGGESHTLVVAMTRGQYASVSFDWDRIDLDVTMLKPDGQTHVLESDVQVRGGGSLPISIVADADGFYRLHVRTLENVRISGSYTAALSALRVATSGDQDRFRGHVLLAEGERATTPATRIEKFRQSLSLWHEPDDLSYEAYALRLLARQCLPVTQSPDRESLGCDENPPERSYQLAITKLRHSEPRRLGYLLMDIGGDYLRFRSPDVAVNYYQQALETFRMLGNRWGEASALYQIGFARAMAGELNEALNYYEQVLPIQRAEHNRLGEARTLNAAGGANSELGRQQEALGYFEQAERIWFELEDKYRAAITELNIGLIHHDWGNFQAASDKYREALGAFELRLKELAAGQPNDCRTGVTPKTESVCAYIADATDNLGEVDNSLADPDAALKWFNDSLPIRKTMKQPRGLGFTLSSMAYSSLLKGDPAQALVYCGQSLPYSETAKDLRRSAITLTFEGMAHTALGQPDKGLEVLERALAIQEEIGERRGQAITLDKMGSAYALTPNMEKTSECFNRAIRIWETVGDQDGETISRYNLARFKRDRGDLAGAREQVDRALGIVESKRVGLTNKTLSTTYFAGKVQYYELDIDLKMLLKGSSSSNELVTAALESNEKARARTFLDSLAEASIDRQIVGDLKENSAPQFAALVGHKEETELKLNAKLHTRVHLLAGAQTAEQIVAIDKEIKALTDERDDLEIKIRMLEPRYATLIKPQLLSLREIRQQLDNDTLLLEYSLGDQRSYVWAITPESIKGFELRGRKEIESTAQRLTKSLTERNRIVNGENGAQWQRRREQADAEFNDASAALSKMVLERVAPLLGNKRLVVVADGALQLVSFAALPSPDISGANNQRRLIDDHEIVYEPSASVLALQRSELVNRKPAPHAVAVLANPVFDKDDERVKSESATGDKSVGRTQSEQSSTASAQRGNLERDVTRTLDDIGLDRFPKLPSSATEAQKIIDVAPKGEWKAALGFDASRTTAMSGDLSKYRIVHFATHGVLDYQHPELSGIVLSMVDQKGQPQDGYLRLHDIYNLNLPADLVVLSACQTGVGKQIKGEGLIALTRGFMYAGAVRVVASLWKVDDVATAQLMAEFYKQMFTDGQTAAAALRAAQRKLSQQPRWRSPYYWAGFVLQGEWK